MCPVPTSSEQTNIHATTIACRGRAAIIRGPSGSGKSGLALQLMTMGCMLVADDRTCIYRRNDTVFATAPDTIAGQIEARFVGLLQAPCASDVPVRLIVDLTDAETMRLPQPRTTGLLGLEIPVIAKTDAPHFPAAVALYLRHGRLDEEALR